MNNKICIMICFWGKWPRHLPFFLVSAAKNNQIDFLILTDNEPADPQYPNIHFRKLRLSDFLTHASTILGFPVRFSNPYKVCDFKPLYGFLFQDYLKEYDYWGYCDLDMVLGDLQSFISQPSSQPIDVLSTYSQFMSGPFSLYRNETRINELFRLSPRYRESLQDEIYRSFDENAFNENITGFSFPKLLYFLGFAARYLFHRNAVSVTWKELRYQFQCSYKKHKTDPENPADITEVIWLQAQRRNLHARFVPLMVTEPALNRRNISDWSYRWENGKLTENTTGEEVFAFHFQESKHKEDFMVPPDIKDSPFIITPKGIFYD